MLNSVIFWKLLDIFILIIEWISLYILINELSIKKVSKNQSFFCFLLIFFEKTYYILILWINAINVNSHFYLILTKLILNIII